MFQRHSLAVDNFDITLADQSENFVELAKHAFASEKYYKLTFQKSADTNNYDKLLDQEDQLRLEGFVNSFISSPGVNSCITEITWEPTSLSNENANAIIKLIEKLPNLQLVHWNCREPLETVEKVEIAIAENKKRTSNKEHSFRPEKSNQREGDQEVQEKVSQGIRDFAVSVSKHLIEEGALDYLKNVDIETAYQAFAKNTEIFVIIQNSILDCFGRDAKVNNAKEGDVQKLEDAICLRLTKLLNEKYADRSEVFYSGLDKVLKNLTIKEATEVLGSFNGKLSEAFLEKSKIGKAESSNNNKSSTKKYTIPIDDDPKKYNDDDITDYKELIIEKKLGGFKILPSVKCKFLLDRKFNENGKDYLIAVTDAVDTASLMYPIDYYLDKEKQPRRALAIALEILIPKLEILNQDDENILKAQCQLLLKESKFDEDGIKAVIRILKEEAKFDKTLLEERYRAEEQVYQRRDVFEEIMPEMIKEDISHAKIIFPYNITDVHWLAVEIKISKAGHHYNIEVYAHDPYGGGKMSTDNYKVISQTLERKIKSIDPEALVTCKSINSPYTRRQRVGDVVSCGIITVEDIIKLILGQTLNIITPYSIGALELREKHVLEFIEDGLTKERFNTRLEAAKNTRIQSNRSSITATKPSNDNNALSYAEKEKLVALIQSIKNITLKQIIIEALTNEFLYENRDGSYSIIVRTAIEERPVHLLSQGIKLDDEDIKTINVIHRQLFSKEEKIKGNENLIFQVAEVLIKLKEQYKDSAFNTSYKNITTGKTKITSNKMSSLPPTKKDTKENTDRFNNDSSSLPKSKVSAAESEANAEVSETEILVKQQLESEAQSCQAEIADLESKIKALQGEIEKDEKILLISLGALEVDTKEEEINAQSLEDDTQRTKAEEKLKQKVERFTSGEDKASKDQELTEKAGQQKQRYLEFNIRSKIDQLQSLKEQLTEKLLLLEKQKADLETEKQDAEKKKQEYEVAFKNAQEGEKTSTTKRDQKQNERNTRENERVAVEAERKKIAENYIAFNRGLANELANVRAFTVSAKSCGWHVNGHLDAYIKVNGHSVGSPGRGINIAIINKYNGHCKGFSSFDTSGDPGASDQSINFINRHYTTDDLLVVISADDMSVHSAGIANYLSHHFGANPPWQWRQAWCFIQGRGEVHSVAPHEFKTVSLEYSVSKVEEVQADIESRRKSEKERFESEGTKLEKISKTIRDELFELLLSNIPLSEKSKKLAFESALKEGDIEILNCLIKYTTEEERTNWMQKNGEAVVDEVISTGKNYEEAIRWIASKIDISEEFKST